METQTFIEYEVIDSVTNESFVTRERYVALAGYRAGDMVYETHITMCNTSPHTQTRVFLTLRWNNNPYFYEEEQDE